MKLYLISGHGGKDAGAVYKNKIERDINRKQVTYMMEQLANYKIDLIVDYGETAVDDEVKLVKAKGTKEDFCISIHNNAGGGKGFECYHYPNNTKAKALCECIEKYVKEVQNSRGIKTSSKYKIINSVKPTSIILEGFFLDNPQDRPGWKKLAKAYVKGIVEYLELEKR